LTSLAAYHRACRARRARRRQSSSGHARSTALTDIVCWLADLQPGQAVVVITPRPIEHLIGEATAWAPDACLVVSPKSTRRPVVASTYVVERLA